MSDMQRWAVDSVGIARMDDTGEYVLASDAEAAIAAAEQGCGERSHGHYMDGQRDMLARAIAAVEASAAGMTAWDYDVEQAIAVLRALAADPCDCDDCRAAGVPPRGTCTVCSLIPCECEEL
jgi:hypothetical protein